MESMEETSDILSSITTSEAAEGVIGGATTGAGGLSCKIGNFLGGAVKAAKRLCSVVLGIFSRASSMPPNFAKSLILITSLAAEKMRHF